MRVRIVFIAGLYHSGSTLLDLLLGKNPQVVGLGEIYSLLRLGAQPACSCGALTRDCVFWRDTIKKTEMLRGNDLGEQLSIVLDQFGTNFGPDRILVDSSKSLEALKLLRSIPRVEVKVIHLVRDVRSWATSLLEVDRRARERERRAMPYVKRQVRTLVRRPFVRFLQWYWENRRIERFLTEQSIPAMRLGYEELVFYSGTMIPRLCQFIEIEESEAMYKPEGSHSHVAYGNAMRHQSEKLKNILYDNRWLLHSEWLLPSLVLKRPVMRYNRKNVYGNVSYPAREAS